MLSFLQPDSRPQMDFFFKDGGRRALSVFLNPALPQNLQRVHVFFFSSFSVNCELFLIMSGEFSSQQVESCSWTVPRGSPAFFKNLLRRMRLAVMGCEATAHTLTVFSGFWLSSSSAHYLQAAGGCLPHLKVSVSPPSAHTHTHTQPTACPCPLVTQPLAPPHCVPLACHFTTTALPPSSVRVCVLIYMSVFCVYWSASAHTSPAPRLEIWLCLPGLYILTRPFSRKPWSPLMEEAPATNSSETRHSNRSQAKWRRHALSDICGTALMHCWSITHDGRMLHQNRKRLCLLHDMKLNNIKSNNQWITSWDVISLNGFCPSGM